MIATMRMFTTIINFIKAKRLDVNSAWKLEAMCSEAMRTMKAMYKAVSKPMRSKYSENYN